MSKVNLIDCDNPYNKAVKLATILDPVILKRFEESCSLAQKVETIYIYHFDVLRLVYVSFKLYGEDSLGEVLKCSYDTIPDVNIEDHGDDGVYFTTSLHTIFMMAETSEVFNRFKEILDNEQVAYTGTEQYTENDVDVYISCIDVLYTKPSDMYATIQINENTESTYEFIKSLRATCYANKNVVTACFGKDYTMITAPRYVWENRLCKAAVNTSDAGHDFAFICTLRQQWSDFLKHDEPSTLRCEAVLTTEDIRAGLKFDTVLPICINGALISRNSWTSGDMIKYIPGGNYFKQGESINTNIPAMFIRMHEKGPDEIWLPNTDDLIANDWIAYDSVK